ncbi:hypothetical protein D9758_005415 [Tetrapyrgos nigripes]|uniref:Serine hydrolase domain-containing protein n=1 Tax=Tetrapyrgos nigripes TaxID=182062 RepID=A0A8H5GI80_9AGAR|nr:hypothetical protein D9758_005415 [Tetrapyrgos nigripes]
MSATRRVLVLHGRTQNASVFRKKLRGLIQQAQDVELVFLDAPHKLESTEIPRQSSTLGGASSSSEEPTPRTWWIWNEEPWTAVGLEETLVYMRDKLKNGRFEGVMGFSMGAALAAFLSALLEHPERYPPFLVDGHAPHPPFKFCVAVSGFKIPVPLFTKIFSSGYSTPTLHVIGKADTMITEIWTKTLLDVSLSRRLETHDGGHFFPSDSNWSVFIAEYLRSGPNPDIPSPSVIKARQSAPSSAMALESFRPVKEEEANANTRRAFL